VPPKRPSNRSRVQRLLWKLHAQFGSWHKLGREIGCDPRTAWAVANGKYRASRSLRMALGLIGPPKPRIPWKRMYLELTGAQARAGVELSPKERIR
jgi:hypothetical protein